MYTKIENRPGSINATRTAPTNPADPTKAIEDAFVIAYQEGAEIVEAEARGKLSLSDTWAIVISHSSVALAVPAARVLDVRRIDAVRADRKPAA